MTVPYIFASATAPLPLSQLDSNFATAITLGSTSLTLGSTVTSVAGLTLTSATITGGTSTATQNLANVTGTLAVGNGGTGLTTLTAGYIPYGNGTSAFGSSANLYFDGTNLGIGTTSPSNSKLDIASGNINLSDTYILAWGGGTARPNIEGSKASNYLKFSTGAGVTHMTIDSSGNVGIGTTTTSGARLVLSGGSLPSVGGFNLGISSGLTTGRLGTYDTGSLSSISNATDAQSLEMSVGSSAGYYAGMSITGSNATLNSGTMRMFTAGAERMRIDSSGNVGIGTSSPANKLDVVVNGDAARFGNTKKLYISTDSAGYGLFSGASQLGTGLYANDTSNYMYFATNSSERMRIDSSGNLLVGTTSAGFSNSNSYFFNIGTSYGANGGVNHISGTASGVPYYAFAYNGSGIGSITQNGTTGVLYNLTSDYRLKDNPVPLTGASDFIMALQPKSWDWWDGSGKGVGFIAHEFMEVAKHSGNGEKDAVDAEGKPVYQSIQPSSSEVMANLVALVQEQQAIIEQLKAKVGI